MGAEWQESVAEDEQRAMNIKQEKKRNALLESVKVERAKLHTASELQADIENLSAQMENDREIKRRRTQQDGSTTRGSSETTVEKAREDLEPVMREYHGAVTKKREELNAMLGEVGFMNL